MKITIELDVPEGTTATLRPAPDADFNRRSIAARNAWTTRRRRAAARKAWETRRRNAAKS